MVGREQGASRGLVTALVGTTPRVREAPHQVLGQTLGVLSLPKTLGLGRESQVEPVWNVSQGLRSLTICLPRGTGPSQPAPLTLSGSHCWVAESPSGQLPGTLRRALHCAWERLERPPQSGKKLSSSSGLAAGMAALSHTVGRG